MGEDLRANAVGVVMFVLVLASGVLGAKPRICDEILFLGNPLI